MPVFAGKESQIDVNFAGGVGAFNPIPKLVETNLELTADEIDASSHDSAGWKEKLAGLKDWSLSGSYRLIDVSDAVQDGLETAFLNGTDVYIRLIPKRASGLRRYDGVAVVTNLSQSGPLNDPYDVSLELSSRGALTKATQ
jgi:predicted secreted protein